MLYLSASCISYQDDVFGHPDHFAPRKQHACATTQLCNEGAINQTGQVRV